MESSTEGQSVQWFGHWTMHLLMTKNRLQVAELVLTLLLAHVQSAEQLVLRGNRDERLLKFINTFGYLLTIVFLILNCTVEEFGVMVIQASLFAKTSKSVFVQVMFNHFFEISHTGETFSEPICNIVSPFLVDDVPQVLLKHGCMMLSPTAGGDALPVCVNRDNPFHTTLEKQCV